MIKTRIFSCLTESELDWSGFFHDISYLQWVIRLFVYHEPQLYHQIENLQIKMKSWYVN